MFPSHDLWLQVSEWIENGDVILFETLTIRNSDLDKVKVKLALRSYKRKLRKNTGCYVIVFEKGGKNARPHYHVMYAMNEKIGEKSHGNWSLGQVDTRRIRYQGDGLPRQDEVRGYYKEKIVGYMVKYISKDISEKKLDEFIKNRTCLSRGFGLCQMRVKLMMEKKENLVKMVTQGMDRYMKVLKMEVHKELARRIQVSIKRLSRDCETLDGAGISQIVKGKSRPIGHIQKHSRNLYKGYEKWMAI